MSKLMFTDLYEMTRGQARHSVDPDGIYDPFRGKTGAASYPKYVFRFNDDDDNMEVVYVKSPGDKGVLQCTFEITVQRAYKTIIVRPSKANLEASKEAGIEVPAPGYGTFDGLVDLESEGWISYLHNGKEIQEAVIEGVQIANRIRHWLTSEQRDVLNRILGFDHHNGEEHTWEKFHRVEMIKSDEGRQDVVNEVNKFLATLDALVSAGLITDLWIDDVKIEGSNDGSIDIYYYAMVRYSGKAKPKLVVNA